MYIPNEILVQIISNVDDIYLKRKYLREYGIEHLRKNPRLPERFSEFVPRKYHAKERSWDKGVCDVFVPIEYAKVFPLEPVKAFVFIFPLSLYN